MQVGTITAAVLAISPLARAELVGYWNFNNMETVPQSTDALPGIASVAPGPIGFICRNSDDLSDGGEGQRSVFVPWGNGGPYSDYLPNGANALNGDPDGSGLLVGSGQFGTSAVIWFPLGSLAGHSDVKMSFWMGDGPPDGATFTTATIFINDGANQSTWTSITSFQIGSGDRVWSVDLGVALTAYTNPTVFLQVGGGTAATSWVVIDNVQFNAAPAPASACALAIGVAGRRRRRC